VTRRKPFKLSRLPKPKGPGDMAQMRNPLIPELRWVRAELNNHADKLPPQLLANLNWLIFWAGWKLEHEPWTPQQIQYQRFCVVREGYELAVRKGLKTGLWKAAYNYAKEKLAGSPAECGIEMLRKSYEAERDATYE
jgi:hypothetical protein